MIPYRVDPAWYEAYWFRERPTPAWRVLLARLIAAVRPAAPAPRAGWRRVAATSGHVPVHQE
jgi:hypothetical protein